MGHMLEEAAIGVGLCCAVLGEDILYYPSE